MTKIVYSACYGGFGLSHDCIMRIAELKGLTLYHKPGPFGGDYFTSPDMIKSSRISTSRFDKDRSDPDLIQAIEELGEKAASGKFAKLVIEDLPSGTRYRITEYDGYESIETDDDIEWSVA